MPIKIYEMFGQEESSPKIHAVINKKKHKITGRGVDRPELRITYIGEDGKSRTIRYKEHCNAIDQTEQITKFNIAANEPFSQAEYNAATFRNYTLKTESETLQTFLESHPRFEGFKGIRPNGIRPWFRIKDEQKAVREANTFIRKQIEAGAKVKDMNLKQAQDLMILINGHHFVPPSDLEACQNQLWEWINQASDEALDKVLEEDMSEEEEMSIIVSRATSAGIISMREVADQVSKKVDGNWVKVIELDSQLHPKERERMFVQWLLTDQGLLMAKDLMNDLDKLAKKKR